MKMKEIINRSIRLLHISRKPKSSEFWKIAKIAGLGGIVIGLVGLIISLISSYI